MLKFIHAADFHLDSAFAALPPEKAAERRREQRELPGRLAEAVRTWGAELALLAGDLFDGKPYPETVEAVKAALAEMAVPVFLAPGNHDFYGPDSPYAGDWPENVHIFRTGRMESVPLPELGVTVHGAAFLGPTQEEGLLRGFTAPEDGTVHIGVLHGELGETSVYDPVSREDIAASGLAYLALGHVHKRTEPLRFGRTTAAWPGCPEGRGFDELGEKGFYAGVLQDGQLTLRFVPLGRHRYWILPVDITGRDAAEAAAAALPAGAEGDLCRILLRGESSGVDEKALMQRLAGRCAWLELRDETTLPQDLWQRAEEDSLRGLFLRRLRGQLETAETEAERETIRQAARFGLAALEGRDLS